MPQPQLCPTPPKNKDIMKISIRNALSKSRTVIALLALPMLMALQGCTSVDKPATAGNPAVNSEGKGVYPEGSFVARHGQLKIVRTRLCDESGKPVTLKGFSSHDLKDFGQFANDDAVAFLARDWNVTVIRAALYVESYKKDPSIERHLDDFVNACEKSGIYCIIDWHVLFEHNPSLTTNDAKAFFARKAQQYAGKKHVIYEICNEPNGADVKWGKDVKPFAEAVIPVIRRYAPDSIVIVGTPTWSQDVDIAAKSPLAYSNVMYAFHFYAGSHGSDVRAKVRAAYDTIPVFCTEWGTTNANGDGGPFVKQSDEWLLALARMGISWCNWSLSDANEASAILKPGANPKGGWTDADLTPSGLYVKQCLTR
jgi:endoglucanase